MFKWVQQGSRRFKKVQEAEEGSRRSIKVQEGTIKFKNFKRVHWPEVQGMNIIIHVTFLFQSEERGSDRVALGCCSVLNVVTSRTEYATRRYSVYTDCWPSYPAAVQCEHKN